MTKLSELLKPFKENKERNLKIFISWIAFIIILIPIGLYADYCLTTHNVLGTILAITSNVVLVAFLLKHGDLIDRYYNLKNKDNG